MKTSATHLLALAVLVLAPAPAVGHEAVLGDDESTGTRRRLGFFKKDPTYYQSIYYRCCNTDLGSAGAKSLMNADWRFPLDDIPDELGIDGDDYCKCPKRGSGSRSWFSWGKKETYFEKWDKSCKQGGSIWRKAGINGNGGD